ncbi:hypothetical protein VCHC72A2_00288B, partial [Vibrio cholerae HC-72A2]
GCYLALADAYIVHFLFGLV